MADGWRSRGGTGGPGARGTSTPAAVVGSCPDGPFVIDLCRDGPHVLVGGTTGSGKSQFLRTLVTSLAVSAPPDELTFVLVDFKGGASFRRLHQRSPTWSAWSPTSTTTWCRAPWASLRAELKRRERLLAAVGAADLEGYHRARPDDAEPLPRLVVVVDELRALVEEAPDFVTGLVRLAALGRSLGVHLVLATQRPSGALTAEVQANVSLRIAFRVRDRADSVDVLDDAAAATIAPSTPGRALALGQTAHWSPSKPRRSTHPKPAVTWDSGSAPAGSTAVAQTCRPGATSTTTTLARRWSRWCVRHTGSSAGALPGRRGCRPCLHPCRSGRSGSGAASPPASSWVSSTNPTCNESRRSSGAPLDGPWLLAGGSRSGRTTALRALALAASTDAGPDALHLHVIDAHGSLADLRARSPISARACPATTSEASPPWSATCTRR